MMAAKAFIIFCAQALLVQSALSCPGIGGGCCGAGWGGAGWGGAGWGGAGWGLNGLGGNGGYGLGGGCGCGGVASTGGGLVVSSASPIPPVGVSVLSENAYEGGLCVGGNLPFLGTVGIEGCLATGGAGAVSYGCGNGAVGIGEAGSIATGITSPNTYAPGIGATGGLGYGAGLGGIGYGAGLGGLGYGGGLGGGCGCGCGCGGIY